MGCNTSQETLPKNAENAENEQNENGNIKNREGEDKQSLKTELDEIKLSKSTPVATFPKEPDSSCVLEGAATKIQAAFRGHKSRKSMKQPNTASNSASETKMEEEFRADDEELTNAATKIQASFRGHMVRKNKDDKKGDDGQSEDPTKRAGVDEEEVDIDLTDPELNKAACKIQATFRGHMVRKDEN